MEKVYTVAVKKEECFGHGDFRNVWSIPTKSDGQGVESKKFHPVFREREQAQSYLDNADLWFLNDYGIVELEIK